MEKKAQSIQKCMKNTRHLRKAHNLGPSTLPVMLIMYNLSYYKGKTYHIKSCSGYWPRHCNLNTVNHDDCGEHCNVRHGCFNGFSNALGLRHVAGPETRQASSLFLSIILKHQSALPTRPQQQVQLVQIYGHENKEIKRASE